MKLESLIALSLFLLALFAFEAYSIEDGDSGMSADQLMDVSNGIYPGTWGEPGNPKQARARWSESDDSESESKSDEPSQPVNSTPAEAPVTAPATATTTAGFTPAISVSGNWSFGLRDVQNRIMALSISQSDESLRGEGTISGVNGTDSVSALGLLDGDKMSLNVTSNETESLYSLVLTVVKNTATGRYSLYPPGGEPISGAIEGVLF